MDTRTILLFKLSNFKLSNERGSIDPYGIYSGITKHDVIGGIANMDDEWLETHHPNYLDDDWVFKDKGVWKN